MLAFLYGMYVSVFPHRAKYSGKKNFLCVFITPMRVYH